MYPYGIPSPQQVNNPWGSPYGLSAQPSYLGSGQQSYSQRYPISQAAQQGAGGNIGVESLGITGSFGQQEFAGMGAPSQQHLSPEEFSGSLGRQQQQGRITGLSPTDALFITELSRSARGLQEVAEQLEGRDQESQRRGFFAATAHVFYVFGILSGKGILIPSELPGRARSEGTGAATACREFGRVLDRVVDKFSTGRGVVEELGSLIERGKICYTEVSRGIEQLSASGPTGKEGATGKEETDQQKKKAA